jgi:hypothetical protein
LCNDNDKSDAYETYKNIYIEGQHWDEKNPWYAGLKQTIVPALDDDDDYMLH